jgi:uncharacterized repeat protein (TIGR01451 family)
MRQYFFTYILFCLFVLNSGDCIAQGWQATFPNLLYPVSCATPDGGTALLATSTVAGQQKMVLYKMSSTGQIQWQKTVVSDTESRAIDLTDDGAIIVAGTKIYDFGNSDIVVAKYDLLGNQVWTQTYDYALSDDACCLYPTSDGIILAISSSNLPCLLKLNKDGSQIWFNNTYPETFGQRPTSLKMTNSGHVLLACQRPGIPILAPAAYLLKTNSDGTFQFRKEFLHYSNFSTTNVASVAISSDSTYLFAHRDSVYELDAFGIVKNAFRLPADVNLFLTDIFPTPDGGFWAFGADYSFANPAFSNAYFGLFSPIGIPQWVRSFEAPTVTHSTWSAYKAGKGAVLAGSYSAGSNYFSYLIRTDENGNAFTNKISGSLFYDKNKNCLKDIDERPLQNWFVRIVHPNGDLHYAVTDSLGIYNCNVGQGNYTITAVPQNALWENICTPPTSLFFDGTFMAKTLDFPIQNDAMCALGWVDIDFDNWEACSENNIFIQYANKGTADLPAATVTLQLDSLLTLTNAERPFSYLGNQRYKFEIGDLDALEKGSFSAKVKPNCDGTVQGQALCITAEIGPYQPCLLATGPLLNIEGACTGDSVEFVIQNLGSSMVEAQEYIVIEDNIMYKRVTFQLAGGAKIRDAVPANGATWRLETAQNPLQPSWQTDPLVSAVVEGCTATGAFSTGFLEQYSLYDGGYFRETTCRTIQDVFDGQTKTAAPLGYGVQQSIAQNTDIEYVIYFQNTGESTARSVVITDTLDHNVLDISSLSLGSSSWPYRWQVTEQGILTLDFPDIMLPNAQSSMPESRGWVKFRIKQLPDLQPGTMILNSAAVSMNYGATQMTTEVYHTVENALSGTGQGLGIPTARFYAYPIPFGENLTIHTPRFGRYSVVITDVLGHTVLNLDLSGEVLQLPCSRLPNGVYFATILQAGTTLETIKIIK